MLRPSTLVACLLAACSGSAPEPEPTASTSLAVPAAAAPVPQSADPGLDAVVARALADSDPAALHQLRRREDGGAAAVLAAATLGKAELLGRAAVVLAELGEAALPTIRQALHSAEVPQRRIAVAAALQLGAKAQPLAGDLLALRSDPDTYVRAAAEFAWKRAVGDTSDQQRREREHQAALQRNH